MNRARGGRLVSMVVASLSGLLPVARGLLAQCPDGTPPPCRVTPTPVRTAAPLAPWLEGQGR